MTKIQAFVDPDVTHEPSSEPSTLSEAENAKLSSCSFNKGVITGVLVAQGLNNGLEAATRLVESGLTPVNLASEGSAFAVSAGLSAVVGVGIYKATKKFMTPSKGLA